MTDIEKYLTPSDEEQAELILKGECPHNNGWMFHAFGHNDKSYRCVECGKLAFY